MEYQNDEELAYLFESEQKRTYLKDDGREEYKVIPANEGDGYELSQYEEPQEKGSEIARFQIREKEVPEFC